MDPLEKLVIDVWDMIFQHFAVKDIIKVTLVSPLWNKSIGESRISMSKVWLKFYWPLDNVTSLYNSQRKYQNFKVQRELLSPLIPVYKKHQWRKVMIRDFEMDPNDYIKLMNKLSKTIEELELWNVAVFWKSQSVDLAPIDFPQLQRLEFFDTSHQLLAVFLGNAPRLIFVKSDRQHMLKHLTPSKRLQVIKTIIDQVPRSSELLRFQRQ